MLLWADFLFEKVPVSVWSYVGNKTGLMRAECRVLQIETDCFFSDTSEKSGVRSSPN